MELDELIIYREVSNLNINLSNKKYLDKVMKIKKHEKVEIDEDADLSFDEAAVIIGISEKEVLSMIKEKKILVVKKENGNVTLSMKEILLMSANMLNIDLKA